jgi:hypothetical protein
MLEDRCAKGSLTLEAEGKRRVKTVILNLFQNIVVLIC